ncbi:transposase [Streptomyces pinistramenti]|uniref:transposase n=1 Tax=Streptomyces pinistramenti TaxID=2884812 RepID=UPI001D0683F2|nr:transposase [Streptomyces pinistramenti]MCB5908839.1 transposase [Streptomyces pinistramenti]
MTDAFKIPVSRNTLLRLIASLPGPVITTPRVVGVHEYAQRKGHNYGTVLVDVETRRPIDLLPDREADTLAAWLAERPGIEIVCRDRAPFLRRRRHPRHPAGHPDPRPVASLAQPGRSRREVRPPASRLPAAPATTTEGPQEETEPAALSPWPTRHRFAERTRAKHATIHALLTAGHSKPSVARQLSMTLSTILRFSRATTPEEMFTGQWQSRATRLDDYKPYLDQRWQEGCTNAWKLWEEIKEQSCPRGTAASVTTSAGIFTASPNRPAPSRHRPEPSPAGSSLTPTHYPKATSSISRPP